MKPCIAIAMSGGVDSTIAAYLLKRRGHPVMGFHFLTGFEADSNRQPEDRSAPPPPGGPAPLERLRQIARHLEIPLHILDIRSEFEQVVVGYFARTYRSGKTPNPCAVCNPEIKFGTVLAAARKQGADYLATGHYARIRTDKTGAVHLLSGRDTEKEQSYFLALVSRDQLARACFPLARFTKTEVKRLAGETGVLPLVRKESQDICFIHHTPYGEFLHQSGRIQSKPGPIVDAQGKVIGTHRGLHLFTVGQRRGINCPAPEPYYVLRLDVEGNRLVVGRTQDLMASECRVEHINWISPVPTSPVRVHTRLRYRHRAAASTVYPIDALTATVRFHTPQSAITPGQCAVFYRGREVLGGGWIER